MSSGFNSGSGAHVVARLLRRHACPLPVAAREGAVFEIAEQQGNKVVVYFLRTHRWGDKEESTLSKQRRSFDASYKLQGFNVRRGCIVPADESSIAGWK